MREWFVIEDSRKNSIFAPEPLPTGYIPRDVAEQICGRTFDGEMMWFTREQGDKMRNHPEWRDTEPTFSPLGFWSV